MSCLLAKLRVGAGCRRDTDCYSGYVSRLRSAVGDGDGATETMAPWPTIPPLGSSGPRVATVPKCGCCGAKCSKSRRVPAVEVFGLGPPAPGQFYKLPSLFHLTAAALASKGRLIRCTVPGSTPNCAAILHTPGLPGVA